MALGVSLVFVLVFLLAAALWPHREADASICAEAVPADIEGLEKSPGGGGNNYDFTELNMVPYEYLGSGDGDVPYVVTTSLNRDLLLRSAARAEGSVAFRSSDLRVDNIICIDDGQWMLALVVQNAGTAERDTALLRAEVVREGRVTVLYGRLPSFDAGETRQLLLSSNIQLAAADEIRLHIQSSDGNDASR